MKDNPITWLQVNNWVPIVTSAIMLTVAVGAVWTRLALIEQKQDQAAEQRTVMIDLFKSVENRYGIIALQVRRIETILDIN